jgi:hypothetical protein
MVCWWIATRRDVARHVADDCIVALRRILLTVERMHCAAQHKDTFKSRSRAVGRTGSPIVQHGERSEG